MISAMSMNIQRIPSFMELTIKSNAIKNEDNQNLALEIAKKLDDPSSSNRYQNDSWKYSPPVSFYRNTFVEQQNENFKKRLNQI